MAVFEANDETVEVWAKALEKDATAVVVLHTSQRMGVWLVQGLRKLWLQRKWCIF